MEGAVTGIELAVIGNSTKHFFACEIRTSVTVSQPEASIFAA